MGHHDDQYQRGSSLRSGDCSCCDLSAATVKAEHRLSYAEAFDTATALAHDAALLTGDPELLGDDVPWRVEDLR
jgi:hypothetical protein